LGDREGHEGGLGEGEVERIREGFIFPLSLNLSLSPAVIAVMEKLKSEVERVRERGKRKMIGTSGSWRRRGC
jgi:hypothetical protein